MKKLIISLVAAICVAMTVFSAEDTRTVIKTYHFDHYDPEFFVAGAELTAHSMAWFTQSIKKVVQDNYYIEPSSGGLYKWGTYNYDRMNIYKEDTIFMEAGKYYFTFQVRIDGSWGKEYRCPEKKEDITVYVNSQIWDVVHVLMGDDWSCFTVCSPKFEIGEEECKTPSREHTDYVGNHSAKIYWTPRDKSQNHFYVQYRADGEDEWMIDETNGTSYTFQNLKSNTSYAYQVSAGCSAESASAWSAIRWLQTMEDPEETTVEPKLTSFYTYDVTSSSASFSWSGTYQTVDLRYKLFTDEEWTTKTGLSASSYTATDLQPNSRYIAQVRLHNGSKSTDWSTAQTFVTPEEEWEVPEVVELCEVTSTGTYTFNTAYAFESPKSVTIIAYTDNNWWIDVAKSEPVFAGDGMLIVLSIELDRANDWRGTYSVSNGKLEAKSSGLVEIADNTPSAVYNLVVGTVKISLNEEGTAYNMEYSLSTKNTTTNKTLSANGTISGLCASEMPDPNTPVTPVEGLDMVKDIQPSTINCQKMLHDGQLYLLYEGRMYNVQGQEVK